MDNENCVPVKKRTLGSKKCSPGVFVSDNKETDVFQSVPLFNVHSQGLRLFPRVRTQGGRSGVFEASLTKKSARRDLLYI